jgi:hypothetical protein
MNTREHAGNLSNRERTWSAAIGTGLALMAVRRGSPILRSLAGTTALALLARSFAGYCAVKAAWAGNSSLSDGVRDQATRMWRSAADKREPLNVQEEVEERADPVGVQEGSRSASSSAANSAAGIN